MAQDLTLPQVLSSINFDSDTSTELRVRLLDIFDFALEASGKNIADLDFNEIKLDKGDNIASLYLAVVDVVNDEALGLLTRPLLPGCFAMLAQIMSTANLFGEAIEQAQNYVRLLNCGLELKLLEHPTQVELCIETDIDKSPHTAFITELILATLYGLSCWLIGSRIKLKAVNYISAAEENVVPIFHSKAPQRYDARKNSFLFSRCYLDNAISRENVDMKSMLEKAPLSLLTDSCESARYSSRVKNAIKHSLPFIPNQAQIAVALNLTEQTLRRRLQVEGETYRGIKEKLQKELAMAYLTKNDLSIAEIAMKLNYSETSALARAFKGWTGYSPALFREMMTSTKNITHS